MSKTSRKTVGITVIWVAGAIILVGLLVAFVFIPMFTPGSQTGGGQTNIKLYSPEKEGTNLVDDGWVAGKGHDGIARIQDKAMYFSAPNSASIVNVSKTFTKTNSFKFSCVLRTSTYYGYYNASGYFEIAFMNGAVKCYALRIQYGLAVVLWTKNGTTSIGGYTLNSNQTVNLSIGKGVANETYNTGSKKIGVPIETIDSIRVTFYNVAIDVKVMDSLLVTGI